MAGYPGIPGRIKSEWVARCYRCWWPDHPGMRNIDEGRELPFFIETRLEAKSICESACAIIFMSGTGFDDGAVFPNRSLHPSARLGFHAPRLEVGIDVPINDIRTLQEAYNASLVQISKLIGLLLQGERSSGETYNGRKPWMRGSLIRTMISTSNDNMRYMETIDDVGRWGIDIHPVKQPNFNGTAAANACLNYLAWASGSSSIAFKVQQEKNGIYIYETENSNLESSNSDKFDYDIIVDEYLGTSCSVGNNADSVKISSDSEGGFERSISAMHLYDAEKKLSALIE